MAIGLTSTYCAAGDGLGWVMGPIGDTRVLSCPGSVSGKTVAEVASRGAPRVPSSAVVHDATRFESLLFLRYNSSSR